MSRMAPRVRRVDFDDLGAAAIGLEGALSHALGAVAPGSYGRGLTRPA